MKIVRVELHDLPASSTLIIYERLHEALERVGFIRTVKGKKGTYDLPTGLYNYTGQLDRADLIRDEAARAAKTVWNRKLSIVATAGTITAWYGLNRVEETEDEDE